MFLFFSEGNYFTESIGVIHTGVYIGIVGIDVNMILHVELLEGGWGLLLEGVFSGLQLTNKLLQNTV